MGTLYWIGVGVAFITILFTLEAEQHAFTFFNNFEFRPWMFVFFLGSFLSWLVPLGFIVFLIGYVVYWIVWWIICSIKINGGIM